MIRVREMAQEMDQTDVPIHVILEELKTIELAAQDRWEREKSFEVDAPVPGSDESRQEKYMVTFPFPYMNGRAHLGHAFTLTKCEFAAGYQRLLGRRCLYPFGMHCTGMPIKASADKLKKELNTFGCPPQFPPETEAEASKGELQYQWQIMSAMGLSDDEIPEFAEPQHWLEYFPPQWINDLKSLGVKVDWRRSFISTEVNPFFDSFVKWTFLRYRDNGQKVKFGRRFTIFSPKDDQPCIDHDRHTGEGVEPKEYTLIKMRVKESLPPVLAKLKNKPVFLVSATLRPEMSCDLAGCWVKPDMKYVAVLMKGGEVFVSTLRAALNMSYQEMMPNYGKLDVLAEMLGEDIIGIPLESPFDHQDTVYTKPLLTLEDGKGTGIVLCIPSEDTTDFAAVRDLKTQANEAVLYREPESKVISRSNDECVVALCDQWYFDYGEPDWLREAETCLQSINTFSIETHNSLMDSLYKMRKLACSRTDGLGTKIPWDPRYLIESLSDCTVHMAYYTVCHLLQGGVWQGNTMGPANIRAEDLTPEVWDYVFYKNKSYPESCKIPKSTLDGLKAEFNYWYPVDLRMSGKDLIPNHLIYYIYGHTAVWPEESDKWPQGIRANGHLLLNSKKMSKSTGNFCTLDQAVKKFSADGTRFTLANAGDTMEDANFSEEMALVAVRRLYSLVMWVRDIVARPQDSMRTGPQWEYTVSDKNFHREIHLAIVHTKGNYDQHLFKAAIHSGFLELQASFDKYREVETLGMHKDLVFLFIETQALLMAPICPHIAEHIWELLGKKESIMRASWPILEPLIENMHDELNQPEDKDR